jgi:hypothetical protein
MNEENLSQEKPEVEADNLPSQNEADDLTSRASGIELENEASHEEKKFDRNEYNDILSKLPPEVQEQAKLYQRSIQSDADRKYQEAARLREEAEELRNAGWDRDTVQRALNDPTFKSHIQQLKEEQAYQQNPEGSGVSDEEWSYLSPKEKALLYETRKSQLEQANKFNAYLQKQEYEKQDLEIKSRYKNYDPKKVDDIFQGLLSGKVQATREHLWKVLDYEDAVKRAYKMGQADKNMDINDKVQASSSTGNLNIQQSSDVPKRNEKESTVEYFKRIAARNAQKYGVKL